MRSDGRRLLVGALAMAAALPIVLTASPASAGVDVTPPTAPTNVRVSTLSFTSLTLAWNASTDNRGAPTYIVKIDVPPGLWQSQTIALTESFGGLRAGQAYQASVTAVDAAGNRSAAVPIQFTTLAWTQPAPAAPANLRAVLVGGRLHSIAWDAPARTGGFTYALYSGPNLLVWSGTTDFTIDRLVNHECAVDPGSTHSLTVQAWDRENQPGALSAALTVTIPS